MSEANKSAAKSGHSMTLERSGSQSLCAVARCKCGWRSRPQATVYSARLAYRNHATTGSAK
jgi:hypothetical protein